MLTHIVSFCLKRSRLQKGNRFPTKKKTLSLKTTSTELFPGCRKPIKICFYIVKQWLSHRSPVGTNLWWHTEAVQYPLLTSALGVGGQKGVLQFVSTTDFVGQYLSIFDNICQYLSIYLPTVRYYVLYGTAYYTYYSCFILFASWCSWKAAGKVCR